MKPSVLRMLGCALLACTLISGCAANGKFASKTNGPVDPTVTFHNACSGAKIGDGVFQAAVTAAGTSGKISVADIQAEHDAFTLLSAICNGPVPADLNSALLAIMADAAPIGALVSKYAAKPSP